MKELETVYKVSKAHLLMIGLEMLGKEQPEHPCSFCLCTQPHYQRQFDSNNLLAVCAKCGTANIVTEKTEDAAQ